MNVSDTGSDKLIKALCSLSRSEFFFIVLKEAVFRFVSVWHRYETFQTIFTSLIFILTRKSFVRRAIFQL